MALETIEHIYAGSMITIALLGLVVATLAWRFPCRPAAEASHCPHCCPAASPAPASPASAASPAWLSWPTSWLQPWRRAAAVTMVDLELGILTAPAGPAPALEISFPPPSANSSSNNNNNNNDDDDDDDKDEGNGGGDRSLENQARATGSRACSGSGAVTRRTK
ncbi:hypothetical protein G3M48_006565 [Beauveria asiatica]|uniref:Uncharacterized protein n=1 Tax=Beauveria asiatica TaxID=1069075 RepID=A0AAW0RPM7_9HYPO